MTSSTRLVTVGVLLTLAASATAIRCWRCGLYSDGVGSITPCNNRSAARLEECPSNAKYCISECSERVIYDERTVCCFSRKFIRPICDSNINMVFFIKSTYKKTTRIFIEHFYSIHKVFYLFIVH
ncbi:hypothetical protein ABMA27_009320 [Loxostege sticticalis]|uniref:Secreted protein n=1 Tax=Loxostege sticticalis TaxID=481309 RepID=A0ABR3H7T8_LOXSC